MAWSFDPTLPTAKDRIRQKIGDMNPRENAPSGSGVTGPRQLDDGTILAFLSVFPSEAEATWQSAKARKALFAGEADTGGKTQGLEASRRFERMGELSEDLRYEFHRTAAPSAPATDPTFVCASRNDPTRMRPLAWIYSFDNPGTGWEIGADSDGPWDPWGEFWQ